MLLSCDAAGLAVVVAVIARVLVSFTRQTTTNNGRRSFFILQENWGMTRKFFFKLRVVTFVFLLRLDC